MMPSSGFEVPSSIISLRSRITSATALIRTSRRAVKRYGLGRTAAAVVFSFPKLIPDPVVPTSCLAPLLAGARLLPVSVMRWFCASTPFPCPNADAAVTVKTSSASKQIGYFMTSPYMKTQTEEKQFEDRAPDMQIQANEPLRQQTNFRLEAGRHRPAGRHDKETSFVFGASRPGPLQPQREHRGHIH